MTFDMLKSVCWLCVTMAFITRTAASQEIVWNQNVRGGYSYAGGPVSIGSNKPVALRYLSISTRSQHGKLLGGNDAAPFESVTTNTDSEWTAESNSDVTIDGIVELDLEVEPGVYLAGQAFDGSTTTNISFNSVRSLGRISPTTHATYPEEGGKILLWDRNGEFPRMGIEFVAEPGILVGDLDDDGTVQFSDFLTLAGNFGLEVDTYGEGDINCNGTVDFEDFIRLGGNFGKSQTDAARSVPEPHSFAMLLVTGLITTANRGRRFVDRPMIRNSLEKTHVLV